MLRYLPENLKTALRGVKVIFSPVPKSAPTISDELLKNCRVVSNRKAMLDHFPKGGNVLEIGSLFGDFSREILNRCAPQSLHLLDLDFTPLHQDIRDHESVQLHQGFSTDVLSKFEDGFFDWIYVDGDHSYAGVASDIELAINKIKPGGYLVFNDFARITRRGLGTFGVHQAVCEFIARAHWPVSFFALEGEALYDIALQKPKNRMKDK